MLLAQKSFDSYRSDRVSSPAKQRAVFLDRDGVINVNHGYVNHSENFDFIDCIFDVARAAYAGD